MIFMKTIYYNASVYTGTLPLAEAFGVEEDVFFFVGTNEEAQKQAADNDGYRVCRSYAYCIFDTVFDDEVVI